MSMGLCPTRALRAREPRYNVISRNHTKLTITVRDSNCAQGMNEQLLKTSGADAFSPRKKLRNTLRGVPSTLPVRLRVNTIN